MASLVDEFVIALGIDPGPSSKGARQVRDELKRTREAADTTARDVESAGKRAANFFGSLRTEVVGLMLAFAGARGIKDFVGQIITGDAATGRLARNMGVATTELSAWEGAVQRVGGKASDADTALQAMASAYQNLIHLGTTGHDADLLGLGVRPNDLRSPSGALLKLSDAAQRMPASEFAWRASRLGISDSMIVLLERGRRGVSGLVEEQKRLGATTDDDAKAAAALQDRLSALQSLIRGKMRPAIEAVVEKLVAMFSNTKDLGKALPALALGFGAIAAPLAVIAAEALAAAAPFVALGLAVGLAVKHFADMKTVLGQLRHGDFAGAWSTIKGAFARDEGQLQGLWDWVQSGGKAGAPPGAGNGSVPVGGNARTVRDFFTANHFTPAQAAGILAAIGSENAALDPTATNPKSGAFGIGQWLGPRKAELLRRYGPNPGLADQLAFMLSEMRGSEHGAGIAIASAADPRAAAQAMITRFYRPGIGTAGDMSRAMRSLGGVRTAAAGPSGATSQSISTGPITIYVPSGDPKEIARGLRGALNQRMIAVQANTGING